MLTRGEASVPKSDRNRYKFLYLNPRPRQPKILSRGQHLPTVLLKFADNFLSRPGLQLKNQREYELGQERDFLVSGKWYSSPRRLTTIHHMRPSHASRVHLFPVA